MKRLITALLSAGLLAPAVFGQSCLKTEPELKSALNTYMGKVYTIQTMKLGLKLAPSRTANNNTYYGVNPDGTDAAVAQSDGSEGYADKWYIIPLGWNKAKSQTMYAIVNKKTGYVLQPSNFYASPGGIQPRKPDGQLAKDDIVLGVGPFTMRDEQAWFILEQPNGGVRFASVQDDNVYLMMARRNQEQRGVPAYEQKGNITVMWADPKVDIAGTSSSPSYYSMWNYQLPAQDKPRFNELTTFKLVSTEEPLPPFPSMKELPSSIARPNGNEPWPDKIEELGSCSVEPSIYQGVEAAKRSPYTLILRYDTWKRLFVLQNDGGGAHTQSQTITIGSSKTVREELYKKVGVGLEINVNKTFGAVAKVEVGVTVRSDYEQAWTWATENTSDWSKAITKQVNTQPNMEYAVYDRESRYKEMPAVYDFAQKKFTMWDSQSTKIYERPTDTTKIVERPMSR